MKCLRPRKKIEKKSQVMTSPGCFVLPSGSKIKQSFFPERYFQLQLNLPGNLIIYKNNLVGAVFAH